MKTHLAYLFMVCYNAYTSIHKHEKGVMAVGGQLKNRMRIDVTVDKDLYKRLKEYSERSMIPMSRIVEKSVIDYLDKEEKK